MTDLSHTASHQAVNRRYAAFIVWCVLAVGLNGDAVHPLWAQTPSGEAIQFEQIDSQAGLSHNTVLTLLQDRQGFLWIGTSDGLNRYDGYTFTVFRHDPTDPESLSDNTVQALAEDEAGMLWIGTTNGINRMDPARPGRFTRYFLDDSEGESIGSLAFDGTKALWVATMNNQLFRYDPEAESFVLYYGFGKRYQRITEEAYRLPFARYLTLFQARRGEFWAQLKVGDFFKLYRYDARHDGFTPLPTTTEEKADAHYYYGFPGKVFVQTTAPPPPDTTQRLFRYMPGLDIGPHDLRFLEDRTGAVWIGSAQGLFRFNDVEKTLQQVAIGAEGRRALSDFIWALYEDRAGAIWVGTRSGLFRYDPHLKPFRHLGLPTAEAASPIMALTTDKDGHWWVGTLGGGLLRYDPVAGTTVAYRRRAGVPHSLPDDLVWAVREVGGRFWVGANGGLCALDAGTGRCTRYPLPRTLASTFPVIYTLAEDPEGLLWVGGDDDLYQLDPRTGRLLRHRHFESLKGGTSIQAIQVDPANPGALYLGTQGRGLIRYDTATDTHAYLFYGTAAKAGLPDNTVWTMHRDTDGVLWLGTDLGLIQFDPATEVFTSHYDPSAMPGSVVYSILEASPATLWLGTNQGLVRFDKTTGQMRAYDAEDGLGNTEFNRRAALRLPGEELLFGGLDGITAFHHNTINDNPYVPPVAITQIQTANRDSVTVRHLDDGGEPLRLAYTDYAIAFDFVALNFTNAGRNRYAYRLDGFDEQWIEASQTRTARYTNLPPGDYVFRVKAANNDGLWNEEGAAVSFVIAPPYWQTWWFRLLVFGALAGVLAAAYRYRVRRLLEMERMRLRIATDLHDDIGGHLSSIALLSDVIREKDTLGDRERGQLAQISRSARAMVDAMRELVWAITPSNDSLDDLAEQMRDTATTLLDGTAVSFDLPERDLRRVLTMDLRRHLFLIYKEALHNIARHAEAEHVQVRLQCTHHRLLLHVADDGKGFDTGATYRGNGLRHLRHRAEQLGADLTIESRPGEGTAVEVVVPIK